MKLTKKIFSAVTAAVCALTVCFASIPADVSAEDVKTNNVTYRTYDDHVEVIKCDSNATSVSVLKEVYNFPVTVIAENAFKGCSALTEVTIPASVTSIGYAAFYECSNLESITILNPDCNISNDEKTISDTAIMYVIENSTAFDYAKTYNRRFDFVSNAVKPEVKPPVTTTVVTTEPSETTTTTAKPIYNNLHYIKVDEDDDGTYDCIEISKCDESAVSVEIPSEIDGLPVTKIGYGAFSDCESLKSVKIPDSVIEIGDSAFSGCTNLTSIEIPDSVTSIGYWAFSGCESLTSIGIPDSVTYIGNAAFYKCTGLTSVTIPDNVTYIGSDAFGNTPFLENQTGVKYAGKWVIGCDKDVTVAEIKLGTKGIAGGAFMRCESLTSVVIPDSVTYIGGWAFYECTGLTSIEIPDSVTYIEYKAFSDCTNLISIEIPDSVTYIGGDAFSETPFLENQTGVKYAGKWVIGCDKDVTVAEIKFGTKGIAGDAFMRCESLTSVVIPDSVTYIGGGAFYDRTGLTSIEIPDSVTYIGHEAFSGCTSLASVVIPDSVTEIGYSTFSLCKGLTSIEIPDSVTEIGDRAFYYCESLTSITIKNPECEIYNSSMTISNTFGYDYTGVIYGYENSTAQAYAEEYGYKFESLGEPPVTTAPPTTTTTTTTIITPQTTTPETTAATSTEATTTAATTATAEATTMTTAAIAGITVPTGVTATKYGDVNLDEEINISDVVAINLYLLNQKKYPLEDKAIANADCVRDNIINPSDSTILMNYAAEIIDISELGK